jgi:hypothetical protein
MGSDPWRLHRGAPRWETPGWSRPCSTLGGGARDTRTAGGGRRSCHAWAASHTSSGRDGRWWLVRPPLGLQPRPRPARAARRADGAVPDRGSARRGRQLPECPCQTPSAWSQPQAPTPKGQARPGRAAGQATGARPARAPTATSPVTRSLAKGRATARSSSCRRLLDAVGPAAALAGASGGPWPTLLPVRQAVGHICTRRSTWG